MKLPNREEVTTAGQAEQLAIDWQAWQSDQALSYLELSYYTAYFEYLAQKFNLTAVFSENGII